MDNHYKWLEENFGAFLTNLGADASIADSLVTAHGDKCYGAQALFEKNGIPFPQGVAIYLIARIPPYDREVRQTEHGWVDPFEWVVLNKERFLPFMPHN